MAQNLSRILGSERRHPHLAVELQLLQPLRERYGVRFCRRSALPGAGAHGSSHIDSESIGQNVPFGCHGLYRRVGQLPAKALNLSRWDRPQPAIGEVADKISSGEMPPLKYRVMPNHADARLSASEKATLIAAMRNLYATHPPVAIRRGGGG